MLKFAFFLKTKKKLRDFIFMINQLERRLLVAKKELSSYEEKKSCADSEVRTSPNSFFTLEKYTEIEGCRCWK